MYKEREIADFRIRVLFKEERLWFCVFIHAPDVWSFILVMVYNFSLRNSLN